MSESATSPRRQSTPKSGSAAAPSTEAADSGSSSGTGGEGKTNGKQPDPEVLRAQAEYKQLVAALETARASFAYIALHSSCPQPGNWCLPTVNCRARSSEDTFKKAFDKNRGCADAPVE